MENEPNILANVTELGAYRIVRLLGGGGMGRVYEAEHVALGVPRALKVFSDVSSHTEFLRSRFFVEGRTLANLNHPRIVRVHDLAVDKATNLTYFAMDLVLSPDGTPRTLEDARLSGVDEEQVAGWFADICEGLDYIHSKGIVHRDITLENLLIGPDGRAVVSDFGISRIFDDDFRGKVAAAETHVEDGRAFRMGTSRYLAPELNRVPPAMACRETDAWALGVCLFRMLAGLWFDDDSRDKCLAMLDDYELPWRDVVACLCAANPSDRIPGGRFVSLSGRIWRCRMRRRRNGRMALACVASALFCVALASAIGWRLHRSGDFREATHGGISPLPGNAPVADEEVRLCPDSPTWSEFRRGIHGAASEILLAQFDGMDFEVEDVLRQFIERQASFYCYDIYWPQERIDKMDAIVASQLNGGGGSRRATTPQLLAIAAEVYRQKRMLEYELGEFPDDIDRIAALANMLILEVSDGLLDAEFAFELLEATLPFGRLDGRRLGFRTARLQRKLDPWLAKMLQASLLAAEAARAHDSALSAADEREHREKCALATRLFKEALTLHPERYRAAERLIALAHDDADEARNAFERCQTYCFDDLRAWKSYAQTLLDLDDPRRERLAGFLDHAFATARYGTWAPAFYVIGRWTLLARYDKDGKTLADRSWAFADDDVRRKTLEVIRRYKDGEPMSSAPVPRRLAVTAIFAASALAAGDDDLAGELVRRIPPGDIDAVLGMAMRTCDPSFLKLKNLVK